MGSTRPMLAVLLAAALFVGGCAMKQKPGESDEDFQQRQQEARDDAADSIEGAADIAASFLPPPWNILATSAAAAGVAWFIRGRRKPAPAEPAK